MQNKSKKREAKPKLFGSIRCKKKHKVAERKGNHILEIKCHRCGHLVRINFVAGEFTSIDT